MIVSTQEISRVMHLTVVDQATDFARPTMGVVPEPTIGVAPDPPTRVARDVAAWPAAGQDPDFRRSRVAHLRDALAAGTYSITAEQVATKMIGRAICDQVAHLVDVL
jgi:hypothetical protein